MTTRTPLACFIAAALHVLATTAIPAQGSLLHYWNFNDPDALLEPSYTIGGGALSIKLGETTEIEAGDGQDFFGENARFGDTAGTHLRVNNPIGAELDLALPTVGYEDVVVRYETRRSGQGAGRQTISYTTDGSTYQEFVQLFTFNDVPVLHTFDFSGVSAANDNSDFGIRITFAEQGGGDAGNNRFDNVTMEAEPLPGTNPPPVLDGTIPLQKGIEEQPLVLELNDYFSDPGGGELSFGALSNRELIVETSVSGSELTLTPLRRADAIITVTADDGENPPIAAKFRVLVYPKARDIANHGNYRFASFEPTLPDYFYPQHMIFLQSDVSDPDVDTPLLLPYFVPHDDYQEEDLGTVGFPYNNTRRTRINALRFDGVSLINTGRDRDLGGALVAVNTVGLDKLQARWLAGTILQNSRIYGIRLQYRIGIEGTFTDVLVDDLPMEYIVNEDGHIHAFEPFELPEELLGEEYVQLLWRYHHIGITDGPRPELRLDDIAVGTIDFDPPEVVGSVPLQLLVEEGDSAVIDLNQLFSHPQEAPLSFSAINHDANTMGTIMDGMMTITPMKRGESIVYVSADDGQNPPVTTSFRVLVFPKAHALAGGSFAFGEWDPDTDERVYPEHMLFLQSDVSDPDLETPLLYPYFIPHDDYHEDDTATIGHPYNNTARTRLNGLGAAGISFINTGRDRDLGGALLALDTRGIEAAEIAWLSGTILRNSRVYAIRLEYRTSLDEPFTDLLVNGGLQEYIVNDDGHTQQFGPMPLPEELLDQEYLQLLWRYHHIGIDEGPRAELRLDDIVVQPVMAGAQTTSWSLH